eukprot:scaffold2879_cov269-Prasinococcus_capsulatus_cf.AAC.23
MVPNRPTTYSLRKGQDRAAASNAQVGLLDLGVILFVGVWLLGLRLCELHARWGELDIVYIQR